LIKNTRVGITTKELDEIANKVILENGGTPSFYQYAGFPGYICISVNDQVIHGIPDGYKLKKEDLVTYDVGVTYNEHFCDSAFSVSVDPDNQINKKIMDATLECLEESVKECMPGNHTGDISNKIEEIAYKNGYEVITDYGGHGCGNKIHEDPIILCYGDKNTGTKLKPGMVICVEPMLMTGSNKYFVDKKNN
jgi:methionyl aminopeptidase